MDAALELLWQESYGAVTIDDICKRADVKKGSFYYFFQSKVDLSVAALDRMWAEEWKPRLDSQFSSSTLPLDRIRAYLGSIYQRQIDAKKRTGKVLGCPLASVGTEVCVCDEEARVSEKIREIFARKRRYLESAIRDAMAEGYIEQGDAAQVAVLLVSFIEGLMFQARIMNDPGILKNVTELGMEILRVKSARPAAAAHVS
ncbi:MAG TPA: TetR/AcrR family transcriptional regulator [Opitutus sp.]|nr:TetR/AcrR family transcriptional regulator [Opitutus sp.]